MSDLITALALVVPLMFAVFSTSVLVQVIKDQRREIQRLTATALSNGQHIPAAVYLSEKEEDTRTTGQILEDKAKEKADWRPLGL